MSRTVEGLLECINVTKYFGGLLALKNVSLKIKQGEIASLIGPNGAGKTTLFNVISGIFPPTDGDVLFEGRSIIGLPTHVIRRTGIARTFQTPRPFHNLSLLKNVAYSALFGSTVNISTEEAYEEARFLLNFVGLTRKADYLPGSLTLQERKKLELARALARRPKIVLIDEVMSGLNPVEVEDSMKLIKRIRDELNITLFWVEHVMKAVMGVAEHVIVLNYGIKISEGSPDEVSRDPQVIAAYLGR